MQGFEVALNESGLPTAVKVGSVEDLFSFLKTAAGNGVAAPSNGAATATIGVITPVNKSQSIRDYYAANPDAKPRQVREALAGLGIEVSPTHVSQVKATISKTGRTKRRPR
jgi:hypothetical protein